MTSPCVIFHKLVKMFSHIVIITVYFQMKTMDMILMKMTETALLSIWHTSILTVQIDT